MYLWVAWNLLCRSGWPWILRDPPAFVSWMLELKAYTTTLHLLGFFFLKQGFLVPQTVPRMALNSWFSWLRAGDYKQVSSTRLEPRAPCSVVGHHLTTLERNSAAGEESRPAGLQLASSLSLSTVKQGVFLFVLRVICVTPPILPHSLHRISLLRSPGCFGTDCVDKAALKLTGICLLRLPESWKLGLGSSTANSFPR